LAEPSPIRGDTRLRRAADVAVALPALLLLSPLLLVLAAWVKLDSPGPALYDQERMGLGGKPFRILKFRSMVVRADRIGPGISGRHDPRVTRAGRILRAFKLDELPQLINILRGEMTLIGPRAELARYLPHFTEDEKLLLCVRPGLTGLGQIHFTEGQAAELDAAADPEAHYLRSQLHEKLSLDLDYLRRRSLMLDIYVVARTVAVLFGAFSISAARSEP